MEWTVNIPARVKKAADKMPLEIREKFYALMRALRALGPNQAGMPHFGKLKNRGDTFHCHLNKGRPTYVVVWIVKDKAICLMEAAYAGTHENAPY